MTSGSVFCEMRRLWIVWLCLSTLLVACTGSGETSTTAEPTVPNSSTTSVETTATTVDTPTVEGPSQSVEDAARDGIVPALAELSVADRVSVVVSESTPEGVWAISEVPGTTEAPDCVIGDREGVYGTDFICVAEYREVLLLTEDLTRIIRAYPLPGQPARLLLVTDEAVYCSRQGDGGLPDSMLCRIDRQSLSITGRIFPYNEDSDYGSPEGSAIPHGDWTVAPVSPVVVMETLGFAGRVVTSGHDGFAYHDPVTLERVDLEPFGPGTRGDNAELRSLLAPAEGIPGTSAVGWDPSHGAPYESYIYSRDGDLVSLIATFSMDDDVALALIYTEGQERPSPETIGFSDWRLLIYPANSAGTAAVEIEKVCGRYDLWAFSSSGSSTLVDDVVWIAEAADCSSG